eukprot:1189556-Prorocentrum_minimum.AAC.1
MVKGGNASDYQWDDGTLQQQASRIRLLGPPVAPLVTPFGPPAAPLAAEIGPPALPPQAVYYISHAGRNNFGRLVDSVTNFVKELAALDPAREAESPSAPLFWLDVFALGHHTNCPCCPPLPPAQLEQARRQSATTNQPPARFL